MTESVEIDNSVFETGVKDVNTQYVTIVLNRPLESSIVARVCRFTDVWICADGGANRLFDIRHEIALTPRVIVGDLDSLKANVRAHYENLGTEIVHETGQDDTDLEKSIVLLFARGFFDSVEEASKRKTRLRIFILGGFGGRLDQTISNLSNLLKINRMFIERKPYVSAVIQMMDEHSLATCLVGGEYTYRRSLSFEETKGVGIVPLGDFSKGVLASKGLKWELDGYQFEFGVFLSTSNEFADELTTNLTISTNLPVFLITSLTPDS